MTAATGNRETRSDEWFSPPDVIAAAREVMGNIELDPASCPEANQIVKAERIYTTGENGLHQDWKCGSLWLNPPFSKTSSFTGKLVREYRKGNVKEAILLTLNSTDTKWYDQVHKNAAAVCEVIGRVKFTRPDGKPGGGQLQGHVLFYLGPDPDRFVSVSAKFGRVSKLPEQQPFSEKDIVADLHAAFSMGAGAYFEQGRLLAKAQENGCSGDEWLSQFGISESYASKLRTIARSEALAEFRTAKPDSMPVAVETLYQLARHPDDVLREHAGLIRRSMSRDEAHNLKPPAPEQEAGDTPRGAENTRLTRKQLEETVKHLETELTREQEATQAFYDDMDALARNLKEKLNENQIRDLILLLSEYLTPAMAGA